MNKSATELPKWTADRIDAECRNQYHCYERALVNHYRKYFRNHPALRCQRHDYSARTLAANLPPGYGRLVELIPPHCLHRFCRSGRSSQALALALLGAAVKSDDSLYWLWSALRLPKRLSGLRTPTVRFEQALAPRDLSEVPRTTKIDVTIASEDLFVAVETKWSEPGLGACSCAKEDEGNPRFGFECAPRVYSREQYWRVAHDLFGLGLTRLSFEACALSPMYQVVRNVAAAQKLAGKRKAGFVLIFDENNPYFRQTKMWPGWPDILEQSLRRQTESLFIFRAVSWQTLVLELPLPAKVREWAHEKHGL